MKNKVKEELLLGDSLSIIRLVENVIEEAFVLRASDVHIDPEAKILRLRYRIDGLLKEAHRCSRTLQPEIISRIKILAGLRTDEHQAAQDGRFRTVLNQAIIDVRVSVMPTYHGENAVLRLLTDKAEDFSLEVLGFAKDNIAKIQAAINKSYGLILVTGPTGSGKTTSLYTLLKQLNVAGVSIITIEDPIEYAIEGIEQIQVNARTGLNFGSGLRSILRQDPNIVMIGEIRDNETAGMAINTALTGHLVLSTLHTNDAATALPRLLDMKIESYLISSTVNIVIAQRLVRKICEYCKKQKKISSAELESLRQLSSAILENNIFYFGSGCENCNHSGFSGRVGVHEVLMPTSKVREAVLKKLPADQLRSLAIEQGMRSMLEDGLIKAAAGITTVEEVLRIAHEH